MTGVGSFPPVEATVDLIQKLVPNVKAVGTVYSSSEANSVKVINVAREIFQKRGIALQEVTAMNTNEVFQAAQVACHRNVQAMWVTGDNTALQSFDAIVKTTTDAKLPLFINDPEFTNRGALACVGLGWYPAGKAGGLLAARLLRGEDPAAIPFQEVAENKLVLNQQAATRLGIVFPVAGSGSIGQQLTFIQPIPHDCPDALSYSTAHYFVALHHAFTATTLG